MKVSEVMHTPVVSIQPTATLQEAAMLMDERNVGCLVVVDHLGYLAGIVTDRDITIRGVAAGETADATVESIMSRDVATIPPGADLSSAQALMLKRGVRRLPVTDELWRPHGMVAMDDVLRTLGAELDAVADTLLAQDAHVRR
jgi:signal-transduction protein with cAMP-binding, CBS, and nucleotidyltransferase domain